MTIGAKHAAFIQLFPDFLPASGISLTRNTKILLGGILVMTLQRFDAAVVSATFTLAALIINCPLTDHFSQLMDSFYKILLSFAIGTPVFFHRLPCTPCTRSLRSLVHSRMLYQLSYRGITC